MTKAIDYIGRAVVVIGLFAILGAVASFSNGSVSFPDALLAVGLSAFSMGIGCLMMKNGGKDDE